MHETVLGQASWRVGGEGRGWDWVAFPLSRKKGRGEFSLIARPELLRAGSESCTSQSWGDTCWTCSETQPHKLGQSSESRSSWAHTRGGINLSRAQLSGRYF